MYNIYDADKKENNEEINIIENIFSKPNTVSENIKEAIIEMNIMRDKRVSTKTLQEFIEKYR